MLFNRGSKLISIFTKDKYLLEGEIYQFVFNDDWNFFFCKANQIIEEVILMELPINELSQYFITLAEYRNKQINEILE